MSTTDRDSGRRAAWQAWVAEGCPIAPRELERVPPCRECGRIPSVYSRFDDGTIQCAGNDRRGCYVAQAKGAK